MFGIPNELSRKATRVTINSIKCEFTPAKCSFITLHRIQFNFFFLKWVSSVFSVLLLNKLYFRVTFRHQADIPT